MHEAQMHDLSIFCTLTYSEEKIPEGGTLMKSHFQGFMKRLRKLHKKPIRFFHCGEYGETNPRTGRVDGELHRPHYHAILYGISFADKKWYKNNAQGDPLFTSETLDKIWTHGHCNFGAVTTESCNYVARYLMKKVNGEAAPARYRKLNLNTGEIFQVQPEYITMSNRPGIGASWYDKYGSDVFPSDTVVTNGKEQLPPRYYLRRLASASPKAEAKIKFKRIKRAAKHSANSTPERLRARMICRQSKISQLKRSI